MKVSSNDLFMCYLYGSVPLLLPSNHYEVLYLNGASLIMILGVAH